MNNSFFAHLKQFINDEEGATAVEYGLMAALIAVVIAVAVSTVGNQLCQTFNTVITRLGGTAVGCTAALS